MSLFQDFLYEKKTTETQWLIIWMLFPVVCFLCGFLAALLTASFVESIAILLYMFMGVTAINLVYYFSSKEIRILIVTGLWTFSIWFLMTAIAGAFNQEWYFDLIHEFSDLISLFVWRF